MQEAWGWAGSVCGSHWDKGPGQPLPTLLSPAPSPGPGLEDTQSGVSE